MEGNKQERYADVKQVGIEIVGLVGQCQKFFQAVEDSAYWHAYLDFLDNIIITGC